MDIMEGSVSITNMDDIDQPIRNISQYVPNEFLVMEMVNDLLPGNSFILESIIRVEKYLFYGMRSKKNEYFVTNKKGRGSGTENK